MRITFLDWRIFMIKRRNWDILPLTRKRWKRTDGDDGHLKVHFARGLDLLTSLVDCQECQMCLFVLSSLRKQGNGTISQNLGPSPIVDVFVPHPD